MAFWWESKARAPAGRARAGRPGPGCSVGVETSSSTRGPQAPSKSRSTRHHRRSPVRASQPSAARFAGVKHTARVAPRRISSPSSPRRPRAPGRRASPRAEPEGRATASHVQQVWQRRGSSRRLPCSPLRPPGGAGTAQGVAPRARRRPRPAPRPSPGCSLDLVRQRGAHVAGPPSGTVGDVGSAPSERRRSTVVNRSLEWRNEAPCAAGLPCSRPTPSMCSRTWPSRRARMSRTTESLPQAAAPVRAAVRPCDHCVQVSGLWLGC